MASRCNRPVDKIGSVEIAAMCGVHRQSVHRWAAEGKMPRAESHRGGTVLLWSRSEVISWIESGKPHIAQMATINSRKASTTRERWVTVQERMDRDGLRHRPMIEVSNQGRVRRDGVVWTPCHRKRDGYVVNINGIASPVSHLVCTAFNREVAKGEVLIHKNRNILDNRASNLAWGTKSKSFKNGLSKRDVITLLRMRRNGATQKKIAERFGCTISTVGRAIRMLHR